MSKKIICLIGIAGIMAITACNKGTAPSAANIGNGPTGVNDVIEARMSETEEEVDYFSDYSEDTEADGTSDDTTPTTGTPAEGVDVDLTAMSGTMVYSEVYNMMTHPSDYVGKCIKMRGQFVIFDDESTGHTYYACIIKDATACCAQGVEFVPSSKYSFPGDFPKDGEDITVVGSFSTYMEGDTMYCTLKDSEIA